MKPFLIIGISAENNLFVSSMNGHLENDQDEATAIKLIEEYMDCKVDRVLIINNAIGMFAPAVVAHDFIPPEEDEEEKANEGPKYDIVVTPRDGNIYSIISATVSALKKAKASQEEIKEYENEVTKAEDYDDALRITMKWVDLHAS